jgi:hypothetical protein
MSRSKEILRRVLMVVAFLVFGVFLLSVMKTNGQDGANATDRVTAEQWEYLALAGPSTTNLTPTGNPRMRKEPSAAFAREAFVLEQHLDKLGANGWELVAVAGPPTDPAYYFKRRK